MLEGSFRKIRNVLIIVLILNWLIAAVKVFLGYLTKSASIMADGFHSFSDGSSNIVGLIGISMACKPKDRDHPYGHSKMENFAAIGIALLLFLVCFELAQSSVSRLVNPVVTRISLVSFIIMAVTIFVNYFVTVYEYKRGKMLKSDILIADSFHTRTDIYVSLAVIASMAGTAMGIPILDASVSLVIVVFIAKMGLSILRSTSKVLCDEAVIEPEEIRKVAMAIEGVNDCHEIRTRGREDEIMVDLHITVNESMHVGHAHDIASLIENAVKAAFPGVVEVIVHIEPETERTKWKRLLGEGRGKSKSEA